MATFTHPLYNYDEVNDAFVSADPKGEQAESAINEITKFVESILTTKMGFVSIPIPDDTAEVASSILASSDWQTASKLLILVSNSYNGRVGIFSRSLCLTDGIKKASVIPYVERALAAGYAVILLRPNFNSISQEVDGVKQKVFIPGSESPEIHTLCVWENVVQKCENATHIALFAYGNGATLCKDVFLKDAVESDKGSMFRNRIKAFITVEASTIISEDDDAVDIRSRLSSLVVNLECSVTPRGTPLLFRRDRLGCSCVSLGLPEGKSFEKDINVGASAYLAIDQVFQYFQICENDSRNPAELFVNDEIKRNGLDPATCSVTVNPDLEKEALEEEDASNPKESNPVPQNNDADASAAGGGSAAPSANNNNNNDNSAPPKKSIWRRLSAIFSNGGSSEPSVDEKFDPKAKLTVNDFDLLKMVGKGAFGKVMLVRKKIGIGSNKIYAMKILKKSMIVEKNQTEHAKSERDILFEIHHPFIVRLRFAFQTEDKLYLVTDYYNGGTLFFHLRKATCFSDKRAKFYSAELLLALDHLHSQNIIYRDLKLENILLDHMGHIALTDFGLSKQNIDANGGATTFCGTPDYVAPELLRGLKYGKSVDWWSFGVLLFEMLQGQTPFFDKNRKAMFNKIVSTDVVIPSHFSKESNEIITKLLNRSVTRRIGSGENGSKDIMNLPFFASIDFPNLFLKNLPAPFKPDVANELDTKYVPKFFLTEKAVDSVVSQDKDAKPYSASVGKFDAFTYIGDQETEQTP